MRKLFSLFALLLPAAVLPAQEHPVYALEQRMLAGDRQALFAIAPYFDSTRQIIEFLGYHRLQTPVSAIAKRMVSENSFFTPQEICIDDTATTAAKFNAFLEANTADIVFSPLADAFILTPFEKRDVRFELRSISAGRKEELQSRKKELMHASWLKTAHIDTLLEAHDPACLLRIASEMLKQRNRFNSYSFHNEVYTDLLALLTGTEIAVEDERRQLTWMAGKDYYTEPKLNLLIYFARYYRQYSWSSDEGRFINPSQAARPAEKEEQLFALLNDKKEEVALNAFIALSTCPPANVAALADEYAKNNIDHNNALPVFPYAFLKQMALLTDYCRNNTIDYTGASGLQQKIGQLGKQLSFSERRQLENVLIDSLRPDNITAFEYWSLLEGDTYSAGRILDIFYSRNWNLLLEDKKQFDCYLKKSALFDRLGIIGICNNYLVKFSGASAKTMEALTACSASPDKDIREQAAKAIAMNRQPRAPRDTTQEWQGNRDQPTEKLPEKLEKLRSAGGDKDKNERQMLQLLSAISYAQIPLAMEAAKDFPFRYKWSRYAFMSSDWGFFNIDFNDPAERKEFLRLQASLTEYDLYAHYLDKAGIVYKNADGSLNYDKIYELLKYDVVVAFQGGGGGKENNEVYSLVKLLELKSGTTLGFPRKLCNSEGMYACYADNRADAWMRYLHDKNLLQEPHNEPVSFHSAK